MPEKIYVLCEGIGCLLKERCQRYVTGKNIRKDSEGYMWQTNCNEEERPDYLPTTNQKR